MRFTLEIEVSHAGFTLGGLLAVVRERLRCVRGLEVISAKCTDRRPVDGDQQSFLRPAPVPWLVVRHPAVEPVRHPAESDQAGDCPTRKRSQRPATIQREPAGF